MKSVIYTIGHSNRSEKEFLEILKAYGIELLVDIRTIPKSRHNPQFGGEHLKKVVKKAGCTYRHMKALGGLRRPQPDSPNTAWRNKSFQGYADYMLTEDFKKALELLMRLASRRTTAIMCAEAVPWRCHRSLVGDALTVRGWGVEDIISGAKPREHEITRFAKVRGKRITYPEAA